MFDKKRSPTNFAFFQNKTNLVYLPKTKVSKPNKLGYNGHETQTQLSLGWIDYGFRQLDPVLGMWHSQDKLAEQTPFISSYAYAGNDPVNCIDLMGLKKMKVVCDNHGNPIQNSESGILRADRIGGGGGGGGGSSIRLDMCMGMGESGGSDFEDLFTDITGNGGWVRNTEIISVNPNDIRVFSKKDEATALTYMIGLSILSGKEVMGFYSTNNNGKFVIVLPTTGIAVRSGKYSDHGETFDVKIGQRLSNTENSAIQSSFFVELNEKTIKGQTNTYIKFGNSEFKMLAFAHTHPFSENGTDGINSGDSNTAYNWHAAAICFDIDNDVISIAVGKDKPYKWVYANLNNNGKDFSLSQYVAYSRNINSNFLFSAIELFIRQNNELMKP